MVAVGCVRLLQGRGWRSSPEERALQRRRLGDAEGLAGAPHGCAGAPEKSPRELGFMGRARDLSWPADDALS